jgi:hypothetical protein
LHRYLDYSRHRYSEESFRELLGLRLWDTMRTGHSAEYCDFAALGRGTLMMFRALKK